MQNGNITANGVRHRLRHPEHNWGRGYKYGEPVHDRLSREIVFIESMNFGAFGCVESVEVMDSSGKKYYRSCNALRRLSILEGFTITIKDRVIGDFDFKSLINSAKSLLTGVEWRKIRKSVINMTLFAVVVVTIITDPLTFVREIIKTID